MFGRKEWFVDFEPPSLLGKSRLKLTYCSTFEYLNNHLIRTKSDSATHTNPSCVARPLISRERAGGGDWYQQYTVYCATIWESNCQSLHVYYPLNGNMSESENINKIKLWVKEGNVEYKSIGFLFMKLKKIIKTINITVTLSMYLLVHAWVWRLGLSL